MDREALGVSVEGAPEGELEGARVLVRYSDGESLRATLGAADGLKVVGTMVGP
jgi:hypothetical protein